MVFLKPWLLHLLFLLLMVLNAESLFFNFSTFHTNMPEIEFQGDSFSSGAVLQITKNQADASLTSSVGRVSYSQPVHIWDSKTGKVTDFTTHFSFIMKSVDLNLYGDGISFFLAPFDSQIPQDSSGGYLALFSPEMAFDNRTSNQIVAVEFDSFKNTWDPSDDHVGINVNSIISVTNVTWRSSIKNGSTANAWGSGDEDDDYGIDGSIDNDFEKGTGPKRFTYRELSSATNNFSERGKLGEGGFGGVYKGLLSESSTEVAVKKVSKGSKQGKKEYISEVRVISRLRHRNLVQLIGWCHQRGELLLVYEFMPNGSLDSHLFGGKKAPLTWTIRYKIALGLASALLYLHEEWEQCVVHRDIKSSNVMLDSNFNTKLGDFGLARLVDHELGSQTTVLAGTMGYLAPECVTTGKASKESDAYSFGVVALEIACGRRPVEPKQEPSRVRLVEWVWDLYGQGRFLDAVDKRLDNDFDENQMECLITVGLWCCHPDYTLRPSIRQAINVLNFEAPLPSLPGKLPVPTYYAPPINICQFSNTSSLLGLTDSEKYRTQCSCSSCSTNTTMSAGSTKALLNSPNSSIL
ncbi:L-type lectin-domain containing receptor kinase IX.1-like [Tripterygium wilfordii]|uniref:L-type lectin-domain containing receptor kinase IX.1-like n=1 Tax=Tripterygium wilfordii TaxID=458696 RepID=UPI0018F81A77|nr:L-type lectin-domain containing receptor kinase IX.1-like [Tripterygium wilfordii]